MSALYLLPFFLEYNIKLLEKRKGSLIFDSAYSFITSKASLTQWYFSISISRFIFLVATVTEATTTADENCLTDCICPCGWVEVQNYTAEELQELVVERQQKLKIDKAILSAQVFSLLRCAVNQLVD